MNPLSFSYPSLDWQFAPPAGALHSPPKDSKPPYQFALCNRTIKDGSIGAKVRPIDGRLDPVWNYNYCECGFLFRYRDSDHCYVAGIGSFGRKFFIGRVDSSGWTLLSATGDAGSLIVGNTYDLRIEFNGDHLTLLEGNVPVTTANDSTYGFGYCGFRTHMTEAEFTQIELLYEKPRCFVIMPFADELAYVHKVIQEVVEKHGFECIRADERFISEPVMEDVKTQIAKADLVIVDFTGRNPNVYFEAGLADAWKKSWIVIAQSADDLAFDVAHIRTFIYANTMGGDRKLREELANAVRAISGGSVASTR